MDRYLIIVYHGMHHGELWEKKVGSSKAFGVNDCAEATNDAFKNLDYKVVFFESRSTMAESRTKESLNKLLRSLSSSPANTIILAHRGCVSEANLLNEYRDCVVLFSGDLGYDAYLRYINVECGRDFLPTGSPFTWEELHKHSDEFRKKMP